MKEIKGFSFYRSYYESLVDLEKNDRNEIINAMLEFVFLNKKPKFKGVKKTIWTLIEPNLNTSKNRSNTNSGAPIGNKNASIDKGLELHNQKTTKKQSKNNQPTTNDIKDISLSLSLSYSLSSSLSYINSNIINNNNINKLFIEYIKLREDNNYEINETIIKRLIGKLEKLETDEDRQEMIEEAIIHRWKDFYPIEKGTTVNNKIAEGVFKI